MLITHNIYHALGQKSQILGCDRELFLINLLICSALIFTSVDLIISICAVVLSLIVFLLLHNMGNQDLLLRHVYLRQLRYKPYYSAQATFNRQNSKHY